MSNLLIGTQRVEVEASSVAGGFLLRVGGRDIPVTTVPNPDGSITLTLEGRRVTVLYHGNEISIDGRVRPVSVAQKGAGRLEVRREQGRGGTPGTPAMPGVITKIHVSPGSAVQKGDPLVSLTAMKMEQVVHAPTAGVIQSVLVTVGQSVKAGQKVVEWETTT